MARPGSQRCKLPIDGGDSVGKEGLTAISTCTSGQSIYTTGHGSSTSQFPGCLLCNFPGNCGGLKFTGQP